MKEIYVGVNYNYKNISTALFVEGNQDLTIYVEEGEYDDYILLENANNINIIGLSNAVLQTKNLKHNTITINESNNIHIVNLWLKGRTQQIGIYVINGSIIKIQGNIVEGFGVGIYFQNTRDSTIDYNLITDNNDGISLIPFSNIIQNNSLIKNKSVNLNIQLANSLLLAKNIFSSSLIGINIPSQTTNTKLQSQKNICFGNNQNYQGFSVKNLLETELEYEDIENGDYRLKDKHFQDIGASEEILLRYAGKSNLEEQNGFALNRRIAFFANYSLPALQEELVEFIAHSELTNFIEIKTLEDLTSENYEVIAFINGIDTHEDKDLIFKLITKVQSAQKPFFIFLPSNQYTTSLDKINLEYSSYVQQTKKKLNKDFADKVLQYNDFNDLKQQLLEKIQVHNPKVVFRWLKLQNIGHFKDLRISLDERVTCLIGLNGTGKTTILRAFALGLIGNQHKGLNEFYLKKLLRIEGIKEGLIQRDIGSIEVNYGIDGNKYKNTVNFTIDSDADVSIVSSEDSTIFKSGDFLQSLIIGFAQTRSSSQNGIKEIKQRNKVQIPHLTDLLPLINNVDDNRLQVFTKWIVDLVAEAEKEENRIFKEKGSLDVVVRERAIIQKVFEILSAITEEKIKFKEVFQNEDVWVSTLQSPEGISIELLSQGYQSVMGWIGYFIQRMAEAYPDSKDFTKEPAICLIDEIDTYLHPKWQGKIIEQLLIFFDNTQFIISTHSPLILSFLKPDNIRILRLEENQIQAYKPDTNPFGADTNRILELVMDTDERANTEIREKLKNYILLIENNELEKAELLKAELINLIDAEDPELIKGNVLIKTKNLLLK